MLLSTSPGLVHAGTVNDDENVNRTERIVRLSHLIKKKKYVLIRNVFFQTKIYHFYEQVSSFARELLEVNHLNIQQNLQTIVLHL